MKVHLIVARTEDSMPWIVEVWDEWTEDENEQIREQCFERARSTCGKDADLREAVLEVPDSFLQSIYVPPTAPAMIETAHGAIASEFLDTELSFRQQTTEAFAALRRVLGEAQILLRRSPASEDHPSAPLFVVDVSHFQPLIGRESGARLRQTVDLARVESKTTRRVLITSSESTLGMNTSFFLGAFGDSVRSLGRLAFHERYRFDTAVVSSFFAVSTWVEEALREGSSS